MVFSKNWDYLYRKNTHMSIWPWSDLVSYTIHYAPKKKTLINVLELGSGAGANIPFFIKMNYNYFGIDGSETIINNLKKKFPKLKKNLVVCDFTKDIPFDEKFDLVIDRASLTHNPTKDIQNCLNLIYKKLKPNAIFIGIDWFSTSHQDFSLSVKKIDKFTKTDYSNGRFTNVGNVHFSNKSHLLNLFKKFKIINLEHKIISTTIPEKTKFATWNFVAKKEIN